MQTNFALPGNVLAFGEKIVVRSSSDLIRDKRLVNCGTSRLSFDDDDDNFWKCR